MLPAHAKLLFSSLNTQLWMTLSLGKEQLKARQIKCFLEKTERNHKLEFLLPYVLRLSPTTTKLLFGLTLKALNIRTLDLDCKVHFFMCWKDYKQHSFCYYSWFNTLLPPLPIPTSNKMSAVLNVLVLMSIWDPQTVYSATGISSDRWAQELFMHWQTYHTKIKLLALVFSL